jgi:phosphopentomutase
MLILTADHGNDPTTPSTDHSREYVPLFVVGESIGRGVDLGTRSTFADVGQTIAELFDVGPLPNGTSFLQQLLSGRGGVDDFSGSEYSQQKGSRRDE